MMKDRGTIKWMPMMLPEHVRMLHDWEQEECCVFPSEKMEWELEELQQMIQQTVGTGSILQFRWWENQSWQEAVGMITAIDRTTHELLLETSLTVKRISFSSIDVVQLVDDYHD
ncbi:YolD-like family protein [Lysinibacillus piscis]|uniref:YolD-like family protein n=1 Tax=Lysinibacillus piscis TaxID=2518931 RepID=A0ABQ5NKT4_9BACI|nr:YolD-like family protein [Lysinibacillus sp. KH24]GLC88922.1 hypothetical protein LYSBPC_20490 [Lysinibacillus sp. KH24]